MPTTDWELYLKVLKTNFKKRTRLEFLQPDNSVAFVIDDNSVTRRDKTFIQNGGSLSVNLQNGMRRTATIQLANVDDMFSYNVNNIWIGTKVRLLGKGYDQGDGTCGDLIITYQVKLPVNLS